MRQSIIAQGLLSAIDNNNLILLKHILEEYSDQITSSYGSLLSYLAEKIRFGSKSDKDYSDMFEFLLSGSDEYDIEMVKKGFDNLKYILPNDMKIPRDSYIKMRDALKMY